MIAERATQLLTFEHYTEEERAEILTAFSFFYPSQKLGTCNSCYKDAVILILNRLKMKNQKYTMIRGVGAYHPHTEVCYNYANLTDEVAEELLTLCPHYIDRILTIEDFEELFEPTYPAYQRIRERAREEEQELTQIEPKPDDVGPGFLIDADEDKQTTEDEQEVADE